MKLYELLILIALVGAVAYGAYRYFSSNAGDTQYVNPTAEVIEADEQSSPEHTTMPSVTSDSESQERWSQPAGSDGQWRTDSKPGQLPDNF